MKLRKVILGLGLVLVGAAVVLVIQMFYAKNKANSEEEKKKNVVAYTVEEQRRSGVECVRLPSQMAEFLRVEITPLLKARKEGEIWRPMVTQDIREKLDRYDKSLLTCIHLYEIGAAGTLNGLQNLPFTKATLQDFSVMATLLKYAEPSKASCNDVCLDGKFKLVQDSHKRLIDLLSASSSPVGK